MRDRELDALVKEVLTNPRARQAHEENSIRRKLAKAVKIWCKKEHLTEDDLRQKMRLPPTQFARLIHKEVGGDLHLSTVFRVAAVLGLKVKVTLQRKRRKPATSKR